MSPLFIALSLYALVIVSVLTFLAIGKREVPRP